MKRLLGNKHVRASLLHIIRKNKFNNLIKLSSSLTPHNAPHTAEDQARYALQVVKNYLRQLADAGMQGIEGKRVLEIGPGRNLSTPLILNALGASEMHVADRFLSSYEPDHHAALYRAIGNMVKEAYPLADTGVFDKVLEGGSHEAGGLFLHPHGLENLASMPVRSIDSRPLKSIQYCEIY